MHNVYIRPLKQEDAEVSYKWRNDPEVWTFTGSKPNKEITFEIENEWILKVLKDTSSKRFAIIVDNDYVGNVQLTSINNGSAEFHIFIGDKNFWGKGVASLATYQILTYAKEQLNLSAVLLSVREDNVGALKSYIKNGFKKIANSDGWISMQISLNDLARPTVSIFCMVYNHEKFLRKTLDGFLMQRTSFNTLIVVGEDCSPDGSREILLEYAEKFPGKFRLLLHDQNVGADANQKITLENCKGKYVAICEGDDYWISEDKLQKQVDFLENNLDYGLVATDFNILHESTGKVEKSLFKNKPEKYPLFTNFEQFLLAAGYMAPCTWLLRNEFLPKYTEEYLDGTFAWLLDIFATSKVKVLEDTTAVYRKLEESASHSKSPKKLYHVSKGILAIQLDFIEKYNLPENFKQKVYKRHYSALLPILILLKDREEIKKAAHVIPKAERTRKDKILFIISKMPFATEIVKLAFYLQEKKDK